MEAINSLTRSVFCDKQWLQKENIRDASDVKDIFAGAAAGSNTEFIPSDYRQWWYRKMAYFEQFAVARGL